ncbi:hypothetical protein N7495_003420 [Penicillium taxi]|uniref:uncharacterized protein n=1 Tax=Penicillium taxi TaxID=168475 RepID=UPI002544FBF3|nr:uncharacterized protein N7495_003420 [Penicillium taxi]KAJ5902892.1 hypothetical protein N7495_003420 [Penicillium taxi]
MAVPLEQVSVGFEEAILARDFDAESTLTCPAFSPGQWEDLRSHLDYFFGGQGVGYLASILFPAALPELVATSPMDTATFHDDGEDPMEWVFETPAPEDSPSLLILSSPRNDPDPDMDWCGEEVPSDTDSEWDEASGTLVADSSLHVPTRKMSLDSSVDVPSSPPRPATPPCLVTAQVFDEGFSLGTEATFDYAAVARLLQLCDAAQTIQQASHRPPSPPVDRESSEEL